MSGKRRLQPAPPIAAAPIAGAPDVAAKKGAVRRSGVRYDAAELFPDLERLSVREEQALELIADGKPHHVIASTMGNSKRTVEDHVARVLYKLHVNNRLEAATLYHRAIEEKLDLEIAQLRAQNRALQEQIADLRAQRGKAS